MKSLIDLDIIFVNNPLDFCSIRIQSFLLTSVKFSNFVFSKVQWPREKDQSNLWAAKCAKYWMHSQAEIGGVARDGIEYQNSWCVLWRLRQQISAFDFHRSTKFRPHPWYDVEYEIQSHRSVNPMPHPRKVCTDISNRSRFAKFNIPTTPSKSLLKALLRSETEK